MAREGEVQIPLEVPAEADFAECIERLRALLQAEPGIRALEYDMPEGLLRLQYDPKRIAPERVQALAHQVGEEVVARWEVCPLRRGGLRCADCVRRLEEKQRSAPGGVRLAVHPATATLSLSYGKEPPDLKLIQERIARAGVLAPLPPARTRAALHEAQAREDAMRRRMALLTVLCLLTLGLAWLGATLRWLPHSVVLGLYIVSYLSGGFYSAGRALRELRAGSFNVDLLMVMAALGAAAVDEWPEGAVLLFLFSASNTLEQYVLGRTRRAIEAAMDLSPEEAVVRREGEEQRISVEELRLGDTVIVRPGERISADGLLQVGSTSIDQSALTGESIPVEKGVGDTVYAGTLNQQGAIEIAVTRLAGESTLARVVQLVAEAQSERAHSQRFTEWFGARYTIGVLGAALLTLLVPLVFLHAPFGSAFYRAMTVLVVASPCAVVISIPATILASITSAARAGVLFKGGAHLEQAATLQAIAFDKTGTLTVGRPRLVALAAAEDVSEEEVLRLAAAAESLSEHPLARAIVEAAKERGLTLEPASNLEALVGRGLRALVGARQVWVGKAILFTERGLTLPDRLAAASERLASEGKTTMFVGEETRVLGLLAVADTIRPHTEAALQELHALGIPHLFMLTGDNPTVARAIAGRLGMEFEAELLPEDKLRILQDLRARYGPVAMVGDGINDAPSLAVADLGISLAATGTDVALETASMVLMADDLRYLPYAISLARCANRIIRQNLLFAFGMMALLLTVTFFGTLRLPFAVLGHEGSTVLVILNGLRLLAFPKPETQAATPASQSDNAA